MLRLLSWGHLEDGTQRGWLPSSCQWEEVLEGNLLFFLGYGWLQPSRLSKQDYYNSEWGGEVTGAACPWPCGRRSKGLAELPAPKGFSSQLLPGTLVLDPSCKALPSRQHASHGPCSPMGHRRWDRGCRCMAIQPQRTQAGASNRPQCTVRRGCESPGCCTQPLLLHLSQ